jgi:Mce-associated membrane protein
MPPARRRPPVGAARPPAGSIRRPKVAGRAAAAPGVENDAVADDATATTPTTGSVDLEKSPTAATTEPGTDSADTVESSEATDAAEPTTGRDTAWWTPKTMLLAALAVVFAVVALLGIIRPGTSEVSNQAWVDTAATQEVTSAGRDALQTVFSYKFDTIDQDQAAARAVLNDERRGEYDSTAEQTKQGVIQTQTTTNAVVTDIGVTLLDGDRAELLASMDIAATQDTVDQGTVQTPVSLTMERVDGKWLLATIDNR